MGESVGDELQRQQDGRSPDERAVMATIFTHGRCKSRSIMRTLDWHGPDDHRRLDRVLQRLRKAGRIHYTKGYWAVGR